jgi:Serine hydrolase (FSH1)
MKSITLITSICWTDDDLPEKDGNPATRPRPRPTLPSDPSEAISCPTYEYFACAATTIETGCADPRFDGVLGFSQGAAPAGLLIAVQESGSAAT